MPLVPLSPLELPFSPFSPFFMVEREELATGSVAAEHSTTFLNSGPSGLSRPSSALSKPKVVSSTPQVLPYQPTPSRVQSYAGMSYAEARRRKTAGQREDLGGIVGIREAEGHPSLFAKGFAGRPFLMVGERGIGYCAALRDADPCHSPWGPCNRRWDSNCEAVARLPLKIKHN